MTELEIQSTIVCIFQVFYIFLQPTLNNFYLFQLFYNNLSLRYLIVVSKIERDIKKKKQRKESLAMLQKEVKQRKKKKKEKKEYKPSPPLQPMACPISPNPALIALSLPIPIQPAHSTMADIQKTLAFFCSAHIRCQTYIN